MKEHFVFLCVVLVCCSFEEAEHADRRGLQFSTQKWNWLVPEKWEKKKNAMASIQTRFFLSIQVLFRIYSVNSVWKSTMKSINSTLDNSTNWIRVIEWHYETSVICAATTATVGVFESWVVFFFLVFTFIVGIARAGFSHRESALPDPLNY